MSTQLPGAMRPLIIPFFIPHAGCPHTCLFCNQRLISGAGASLPSTDQIVKTVQEWLDRSPGRPTEVAFYGGSFTLLPQEQQQMFLEAVQPLIEQRLVTGVRISTRPDALDDQVLAFLAALRVQTIEIGVQSLDEQVLLLSGRGHTSADSLQALMRVKASGFQVGAQLLPGLPGDSPEKALAGMNGIIQAGAQFVRIYPAVVLEGTALADQYRAGQYQPPDLYEGVQTCARMLHLCLQAGVPVIRIGLQAEEGLQQEGAVLAGCWHPALGQLVRSQLYFDLICNLAKGCNVAESFMLVCHPRYFSEVVGNRRSNLLRLQKQGIVIYHVEANDTLAPDEIMLKQAEYYCKGSIITNLYNKEC